MQSWKQIIWIHREGYVLCRIKKLTWDHWLEEKVPSGIDCGKSQQLPWWNTVFSIDLFCCFFLNDGVFIIIITFLRWLKVKNVYQGGKMWEWGIQSHWWSTYNCCTRHPILCIYVVAITTIPAGISTEFLYSEKESCFAVYQTQLLLCWECSTPWEQKYGKCQWRIYRKADRSNG